MAATDIPEIRLPDDWTPSTEIFERCLEAGDTYRELKDTVESRRGDTWEADRRRAAQRLLEVDAELENAQRMEKFVAEMQLLREVALHPARPESRGPDAAFDEVIRGGYETPGEQFIRGMGADPNGAEIGVRNMISEDDGIQVRNLLSGSPTTAGGIFAPVGQPFLSPSAIRRMRFSLRDLIPTVTTNLSSVPYIRETNAAGLEGGASAVAEASAKPEVTMNWEQADAPIRKIAAWIQATMEALDDAPVLRGYIDSRLAYMLHIREEFEMLQGGGTAPHLKGILDYTSGNIVLQTQSLGGDLFAAVGSAIGKVENVDLSADGAVINPLDYWAAVVARHSTWFDGNVANQGNAPFGEPSPTVWGLPVVRSRGVASGTSIVGAFGMGATIFQREGTTIRTTDSHASLFVSNTWIILAEERVGLAVHRPDAFVKIT